MNTLKDLQRTTGGVTHGDAGGTQPVRLGAIVTDSRQVAPGSVFWALAGSRHDGADFAREAFDRGAAGVVAARAVETPAGRWSLAVDDSQKALWHWAARVRRQFTGMVIAVTGSVGKTTTRQMIHTVLRTRLTGTASPRNYNNQIGVPLSILEIEPEYDYAVLELGASGEGQIARLARLAEPTIGVITHVGDAHLGGFGSRAKIADAKAELLAALPPDGYAVAGDDPWLRQVIERSPARVTRVGLSADCDVMACDVRSRGGTLAFRVGDCEFSVPVWGKHHLTAALATVAVGRNMGFDVAEIAEALRHFEPVPMRCEVTEVRGATIINDAYNASPMAMEAALEVLRDFDTPGRRMMVCGDMKELGGEAAALHHRLGGQAVTLGGVDLLLACGEYARYVVGGARAAGMPPARSIAVRTPEETLPYLGQAILPGDVVLVKGARSLELDRVVKALHKYPLRRGA